MERRVLKGFNLATVENVVKEAFANDKAKTSKDIFSVIAKAIGNKEGGENQVRETFNCIPFSTLAFNPPIRPYLTHQLNHI